MRGSRRALIMGAVLLVGCRGVSTPHANAGEDRQAARNSTVTLDGTGSSPGDLTYRWVVREAPAGVTVELSDPTSATPSFFAPAEGQYRFALAVWQGPVFSEIDEVIITAVSTQPTAQLASLPEYVLAGETVTLDGSASADEDGDALTFLWELTPPAGSAATLSNASSPAPSFVADVDGVYSVRLTVSDGTTEAGAEGSVRAVRPIRPLALAPVDAEYSAALDRIVAVATGPDRLCLIDPVTAELECVPLSATPTSVSVGPDGLEAIAGHSVEVTWVDLQPLGVVGTPFITSVSAGDVVLAAGFAYVFPSAYNDDDVRAVDLSDGSVSHQYLFGTYANTRGLLHPGGQYLYAVSNGLSPGDLWRYTIDSRTRSVDESADSPYHGEYDICGDLWPTHGGQRVLTACGNAFHTNGGAAGDMTWAGALDADGETPSVAHASFSVAADELWVVRGNEYSDLFDHLVQRYDPEDLTLLEEHTLPPFLGDSEPIQSRGRFVFHSADGSRRFVIVHDRPESGAPATQHGLVEY